MDNKRPRSSITIVFRGGNNISVASAKSPEELRAIMKCDDNEEVVLEQVGSTPHFDQMTKTVDFVLVNEKVFFKRGDVLLFAINETADPPNIVAAKVGIIDPGAVDIRRMQR
mgnify:CR=1 FL=1